MAVVSPQTEHTVPFNIYLNYSKFYESPMKLILNSVLLNLKNKRQDMIDVYSYNPCFKDNKGLFVKKRKKNQNCFPTFFGAKNLAFDIFILN